MIAYKATMKTLITASMRKHAQQITMSLTDHQNTHATVPTPSRRKVLSSVHLLTVSNMLINSTTHGAEALPLAPLGKTEHVGGDKLINLTPQAIADILARNLREGQYFITADLTPEVFDDNCRFKDPTNDVVGLKRYLTALGLLFDPNYSAVRLKEIKVISDKTIEAEWMLGGYLRLPWHPRIEPFTGKTVYYLNNQNLIVLQDQTWSISGAEALRETFTPTTGFQTDIVNAMSKHYR